MIENVPELFGIGLAAGVLGALLGVGGGVLLVPGFALIADLPLRGAVAASLVCVVATSVASSVAHLRGSRIDLSLGLQLQLFAVIGAVSAGLVAVFIPPGPLYIAFAVLLLYTAVQMWPRTQHADPTREAARSPPQRELAAGGSFAGGAIAGLLGIGGGIMFVPILHLLLRRPFTEASATSIYMIGLTSASAALVYLARGDVATQAAAVAILGVLVGSGTGAAVGHRIGHRALKIGFAVLLVFAATQMVRRGLAQF